jgi:putative ABC transport system ATP-binding protein
MGGEGVQAVRGVDVRVATGEFVALMGASGSGKSTLMHILGCLDTPTGGIYRLEGREVGKLSRGERARVRNRRIGFVFQSFNLMHQLNALDNVALPLLYRSRGGDVRGRASDALSLVGLAHRSKHRPRELSGGERQRVAIARALVTDPAIILADEPTGNMDTATGDGIMSLLADLHRKGRTILLVTHDVDVAAHAQRTLRMRDGQIVQEELNDVAH